MKKNCGILFAIILILLGILLTFKKPSPQEPDVVGSVRAGQSEFLTVVANQKQIDDKKEFALLLIEMYKENDFQTIKFSIDKGYATSLEMQVYLKEKEVGEKSPALVVKYVPVEYNKGYDVVNNPDKFKLYIDGELIE